MPAPTASHRKRILENIQTALRGITGNPTYHYTVKSDSVTLEPLATFGNIPVTELPAFIVEPAGIGTITFWPATRLHNVFGVLVTGYHVAPEGTSRNRKYAVWEQLFADIEVALTQDITRGALAIDTLIHEPQMAADVGAGNGVECRVPVDVRLIRTYGTP